MNAKLGGSGEFERKLVRQEVKKRAVDKVIGRVAGFSRQIEAGVQVTVCRISVVLRSISSPYFGFSPGMPECRLAGAVQGGGEIDMLHGTASRQIPDNSNLLTRHACLSTWHAPIFPLTVQKRPAINSNRKKLDVFRHLPCAFVTAVEQPSSATAGGGGIGGALVRSSSEDDISSTSYGLNQKRTTHVRRLWLQTPVCERWRWRGAQHPC